MDEDEAVSECLLKIRASRPAKDFCAQDLSSLEKAISSSLREGEFDELLNVLEGDSPLQFKFTDELF